MEKRKDSAPDLLGEIDTAQPIPLPEEEKKRNGTSSVSATHSTTNQRPYRRVHKRYLFHDSADYSVSLANRKNKKKKKENEEKEEEMLKSLLWIQRFSPERTSQLYGNTVERAQLREWVSMDGLQGRKFRKTSLAVLYGVAGVGKSASAKVIARELGFHPIVRNLSAQRSVHDTRHLLTIADSALLLSAVPPPPSPTQLPSSSSLSSLPSGDDGDNGGASVGNGGGMRHSRVLVFEEADGASSESLLAVAEWAREQAKRRRDMERYNKDPFRLVSGVKKMRPVPPSHGAVICICNAIPQALADLVVPYPSYGQDKSRTRENKKKSSRRNKKSSRKNAYGAAGEDDDDDGSPPPVAASAFLFNALAPDEMHSIAKSVANLAGLPLASFGDLSARFETGDGRGLVLEMQRRAAQPRAAPSTVAKPAFSSSSSSPSLQGKRARVSKRATRIVGVAAALRMLYKDAAVEMARKKGNAHGDTGDDGEDDDGSSNTAARNALVVAHNVAGLRSSMEREWGYPLSCEPLNTEAARMLQCASALRATTAACVGRHVSFGLSSDSPASASSSSSAKTAVIGAGADTYNIDGGAGGGSGGDGGTNGNDVGGGESLFGHAHRGISLDDAASLATLWAVPRIEMVRLFSNGFDHAGCSEAAAARPFSIKTRRRPLTDQAHRSLADQGHLPLAPIMSSRQDCGGDGALYNKNTEEDDDNCGEAEAMARMATVRTRHFSTQTRRGFARTVEEAATGQSSSSSSSSGRMNSKGNSGDSYRAARVDQWDTPRFAVSRFKMTTEIVPRTTSHPCFSLSLTPDTALFLADLQPVSLVV